MRDAPPSPVHEAIASELGRPSSPTHWTRTGGSALNAIFRLDIGDERGFVKLGRADRLDAYAAEAAGLRALAAAHTVRVPRVMAVGEVQGHAWLVLEWLDLDVGGRDAALGRALAALHRTTAVKFGWDRDNTIGTTPQRNAWHEDWAQFFVQRRLAPQLDLAGRGGHRDVVRAGERLLPRVERLLAGHTPAPSLLHGDLWSGNAGRTRDGAPVIFDPAIYFGDREVDLAMAELFGGFAPSFYAAYREAWPVDAGYEMRRTLYNLYHVLNHLNLFGSSYAAQALQMIGTLAAQA